MTSEDRGSTAPGARPQTISRWQRALPGGGAIAAAFTTLCCLGVSSAVSLASAVGAGVFVKDAVLQPALVITLAIAAIGASLTFRRHRNPLPLAVTLAAGVWIYWFTFPASGHAGHGGDGDHMSRGATGASSPSDLAWVGLAALIAAQVYDALRTTRACRPPPAGNA